MQESPKLNQARRATERLSKASERLNRLLGKAELDALEQARGLAALSARLLEREERVAEEERGTSASLGHIGRAAETSRTLRDALDELRVLEQIERPKVTERDALIEGRCLDANGQGAPGCKVFLADAQGTRVRGLGAAETEASGYFALVLAEENLRELSGEGEARELSLVVESIDGDTVYEQPDSLEIEPGAHVNLGNLVISE